MREFRTGLLMLLVCIAIYSQIDPRIWGAATGVLAQLLGFVG
jgi:hypothetical protein